MRGFFIRTATNSWQYLNLIIHSAVIVLIFPFTLQAQEIEGDRGFGGDLDDNLTSIQQTRDGGYILGGTSNSGVGGDKTEASRGGNDFWIVKIDVDGNKLWDRTYGGSENDNLNSIIQTSDGGFLLGGSSFSGISGDKSEDAIGEGDGWVVKIDSVGNIEWDRTLGGESLDAVTIVRQDSDQSYVVGASSASDVSGNKTAPSVGEFDYWIVRLATSGEIVSDRTYGGEGVDQLTALELTSDAGLILGGFSNSSISGDKSEETRGLEDYWVVKLDSAGNKEWDRTLGGSNSDLLQDLQPLQGGGYIIGGSSSSGASGDKTEPLRGEQESDTDYWIVKLNSVGEALWDRAFGGSDPDTFQELLETTEGGFLLGGTSTSEISGDKTDPLMGFDDFWVIRTDSGGTQLWDVSLGGDGSNFLAALSLASDGGYIIGGSSDADISDNKSEPSRGGFDYWVLKLIEEVEVPCTPPTTTVTIIPTSNEYTKPTSNEYTKGDSSVIYLGYGQQSVQLVASGGERFAWSPAEGLSSDTIANPIFTPTAAGNYIFNVIGFNGTCTDSAMVTITVIDVRCGKGKILVCHKGKVICIPSSAVEAHLRNHNKDRLGYCVPKPVVENDTVTVTVPLRVFPNPFFDLANIEFSLPIGGQFRLELYNTSGKLLGVVAEGEEQAGQVVRLDLRAEQLREGIYYLRLITRDKVQTVRVILKK